MPPDNIRRLRRPELDDTAPGRRWKTNWPAEVTAGTGPVPCVVLDISSWGARLSVTPAPAPESRVWLTIENIGSIAARIAWQRDGHAGLHFLEQQSWIRRLHAHRLDPATWHNPGHSRTLS